MSKVGKYIEIQNNLIARYRIDICHGDKCRDDWSRTHAHSKIRRVCKWKQANSLRSTFTLFHEVGHIETTTYRMRRCESEYYATTWAINCLADYGIFEFPKKLIETYQNYIWMELDRGLRRGGKHLPTKEQLSLDKYLECKIFGEEEKK